MPNLYRLLSRQLVEQLPALDIKGKLFDPFIRILG